MGFPLVVVYTLDCLLALQDETPLWGEGGHNRTGICKFIEGPFLSPSQLCLLEVLPLRVRDACQVNTAVLCHLGLVLIDRPPRQ